MILANLKDTSAPALNVEQVKLIKALDSLGYTKDSILNSSGAFNKRQVRDILKNRFYSRVTKSVH